MPEETRPERSHIFATANMSALPPSSRNLEPSSRFDKRQFLLEILRSRRELEIARRQFNQVSEPDLIDHAVFRIGAAERHLNYLFRLARTWGISYQDMEWDWTSDEWKID